MVRLLLSILMSLSLFACTRVPPAPEPMAIESIPELEYVVITYGNHLDQYRNLILSDSRAYFDEKGFESIWLKFTSQDLVDMCQARDLIVYVVEGLLKRINNDGELIGYLEHFPLTAVNLKIEIKFECFHGRFVDPLYIGLIQMEDGLVEYYAFDALEKNVWEWDQRVETYDKAYRFSCFKKRGSKPENEDEPCPMTEEEKKKLEATPRGHRMPPWHRRSSLEQPALQPLNVETLPETQPQTVVVPARLTPLKHQ